MSGPPVVNNELIKDLGITEGKPDGKGSWWKVNTSGLKTCNEDGGCQNASTRTVYVRETIVDPEKDDKFYWIDPGNYTPAVNFRFKALEDAVLYVRGVLVGGSRRKYRRRKRKSRRRKHKSRRRKHKPRRRKRKSRRRKHR